MKAALFALTMIVSATSLLAREPAWVFNNGPDAQLITLGQGQLLSEGGLTKLIPTGTDLTLSLPMGSEDTFAAEERPFFALRYKYQTTISQGGLFFTTDTLTTLSDKSYSPFTVVGDNTWRTVVVDMRSFRHGRWTGTITSFRLDPTNPSDTKSRYQVSRLGFFPSQEEAQAFLDAADDAPDYSEPTSFVGPLQRVHVPGGCLFDGFDQAEFMLASPRIDQPSETTVVQFRAKDSAAEAVIVPVCRTNRRGFTHFVAKKPGDYRLVNREVRLTDIDDLAADVQKAIRFAVARRLLDAPDGHFQPAAPLTDADWHRAAAALDGYDVPLHREPGTLSRAEAALLLEQAIETALGVAIDSPFTNEYLTRDRIRIGAWVSPRAEAVGDDFLEIYRAGGFDWIIAHGGAVASARYRDKLLQDCDRYGIELILGDGAYENPVEATAEYFDHPCFAGTYVTDEPGTDQYDDLAAICNTYWRETGGKLPYINLLPMYANAAQLKYGASAAAIEYYDPDPDLFKKYCDLFCEKFDPPYICTDIYPLNWADGKRTTYPEYCESINVIARSAREHDKDFWCCIQTFAWVPSKRTPTESEFRWQSYCMLSFGCKGLLCWTYAGYRPEFPSLITSDGKRTNAWYDAAVVFDEIHRISDAFVKYRNLGAFSHNCTEQTPYLRFSQPVEQFPTIRRIACDDPLLIGCFTARDGTGTAFTVVNMSELEAVKTVQVGLQLDGTTVVAWPRGQRTVLTPDADGSYPLTLGPGEGVFVEVE